MQPLVGILLALGLTLSPTMAQASPHHLDPISMSFPSPHVGYVLSLYDCSAKTCVALSETHNAALSWSPVPTPSELDNDLRLTAWSSYATDYTTLTVHFADARDGWIYGTVPAPVTPNTASPNLVSRLWSTHNGGKTWRKIRLGPLRLTGGVVQMATHGLSTYLFGINVYGPVYILATPSDSDQWTSKSNTPMEMPAGGTELEGAFSFAGPSGWFVGGNDRGFTSSARLSEDGSWIAWNGPSLDKSDASFSPITAVTNKVLLVVGQSAGFVTPPVSTVPRDWNDGASWLFISYDAGATFRPFRQLSRSNQESYSTVPGLPAAPVPGTILLQQSTRSGYQLVRSTDWGRSWQIVLKRTPSQIVFTNRTEGFTIVLRHSYQLGSSLFRTFDAGGHWSEVSV
jgi:hypothetical protein